VISEDEPTRLLQRATVRRWSSAWATTNILWLPISRLCCLTRATLFFLQDGDLAVITTSGVQLTDFDGKPVKRESSV